MPTRSRRTRARLSAEFGTRIEGFATFVERARRGGHEVREWTYIRKDGTRLTVLLAVTAVFDSDGRIDGFLGIATDVTERQRAEQKLVVERVPVPPAGRRQHLRGGLRRHRRQHQRRQRRVPGHGGLYAGKRWSMGKLPWDALVPPDLGALAPADVGSS